MWITFDVIGGFNWVGCSNRKAVECEILPIIDYFTFNCFAVMAILYNITLIASGVIHIQSLRDFQPIIRIKV